MLVQDIMSRNVICVLADTKLHEAARIMVDNGIGCVVIKNDNDVAGIITERDIMKAVAGEQDLGNMSVSDVMSRYVISIDPSATVDHAATVMINNKIKKLPVMKSDQLVGIITSTDIVAASPGMPKEVKGLLKKSISRITKH
jgi:CBS domain-containing protein